MPCCGLISSEQPIGQGASPELQLSWGYSLTLGGRWYMEDYHTAEVKEISPGKLAGCFAIYDGHGGRQCVQYVQKRLFKAILAHRSFAAGDIPTAMYEGYMQIDEKFSSRRGRATCGTTSTTIIVYGNTLYVAHCGDSRAVLVEPDGVMGLTRDHKPADPSEAARIQERGGTIVDDDVPRVCGVLAVTRAFGNNTIKSTVNAEPELSEHPITPNLEYVVIASDGVWDVLSNEDVAELIRKAENVRMAAEDITLEAYRLGSSDNISAVVVALNYTGPVPLTSSLANAVRNFSNRGVRPGAAAAGGAGALTSTFDPSHRGGRGGNAGTNGAEEAGKGGSAAGVSGVGQDRASSHPSAIAAAGGDPSSHTPPHTPPGEAVGYSVSPPERDRASHPGMHDERVSPHGYPPGSSSEHASQDTAAHGGATPGYLPQQSPDGMQGGAMDQYQYEYEDDGVVFEGNTPDSATYNAAANSPDAEARYWERMQNLPPDQAGFSDQGDYGDYGGGGWGYGGYGVSRWGHLEDIAEEGESAGLSGSQHMPGSAGGYHSSRPARSSSIEQRQWSRGDRNGSLQIPASPSPEGGGATPPRSQSPTPGQASPPREPSPPANGALKNLHGDSQERNDPVADLDVQREAQTSAHYGAATHTAHAAADDSYDAGQAVYHNVDQDILDSAEYGAVQAHAHQYNSVVMGEHAYPPGDGGCVAPRSGEDSVDHSQDGLSNYNSAGGKKNRRQSSPVRTAKTQPVRRPHSGGATDPMGRDKGHSASGNSSFMSQKSSASQPISVKSSKSARSEGSPRAAADRVKRALSGSSSPKRASSKRTGKRPPFRF